MLVTSLFYLLIGALIMGGIYLAHPEIVVDGDLDDIFLTESSNTNCVIGCFLFLAVIMIWLPVFIAVIIKMVSDKIRN